MGTSQGRENNFDFIRLSMATLVIFSHSFPLATGRQLANLPDAVSLGKLAVCVFFAVSGYLIAMSWDRSRSASDYARRRILRIYPGFLVAFALSAWVVAPLASTNPSDYFTVIEMAKDSVHAVLLHAVTNPTAFTGNPHPHVVNGSLWTIPYEAWCYVGIALIGGLKLLIRPAVLLLFLVAWFADLALAKGIVIRLWPGQLDPIIGWPTLWPRFLTWFLSGTVVYVFRAHIRFNATLALLGVVAIVATIVLRGGEGYVWPFAVPYVTFWFAFHPRINLRRTTELLGGDYSYGVYLYAFPIQQLLVMYWLRDRPLTLFAMSTLLTLAAAFLSWNFVERPFLKRKTATPEALPARELVAAP